MKKIYLLFIYVGITFTVYSQTPALLKDVNNFQTNSSIPNIGTTNYTLVGSTVFFTANDGINGTELWKTDGTAVGTVMVKDINPGQQHSQPSNLTNVNGVLYFAAAGGYGNSNATIWNFKKAPAQQPVP